MSIIHDNSTSASGTTASLVFSHQIIGGANLYLTVATMCDTGNVTPGVSGVTYAGVAMTLLATTEDAYLEAKLWGLKAPALGTNNVVVTVSASRPVMACASSRKNVDQTTSTRTPAGASASGTLSTVTPTTIAGDVVVDVLCMGVPLTNLAVGAGQTARFLNDDANPPEGGSSDETAIGASTAMTWSWTTTRWWFAAAVPLIPGPVPGGGPMWWFYANKWKDFLRDVKRGLVPPGVLRRQYQDLTAI